MSRVLALIGAVCLIAAAILARALLTDDGDDDGAGDDDGDAELVVACIPELEDACRAIDRPMTLSIEDPAVTIERLAAGEDVDAWVTFGPWPEMATILERRIQPADVVPVAATDLRLLVRTIAIPDGCDDPATWTCLVDGVGDRVAIPSPSSGLGALVLGQAAADFFGSSAVASNDLSEPGLAGRLSSLEVDDDPLGDMRVGLPEPVATGLLGVDLDTLGARTSNFTDSPSGAPATVSVVVAGRDADRVAGEPRFTEALEAAGWTIAADAATTGLPNAGVLIALRSAVG